MTDEVTDEKTQVATIRRRKKIDRALSDASCTPAEISDLLPWVDFDPCSNPRSIIKAHWSWSLEKGYDGRKMPWRGEGFLNNPYGEPLPWMEKAQEEMSIGRCTGLIVLTKLDPTTEWWKVIIEPTLGQLDRWEIGDRVQFDEHPEIIRMRQIERLEAGKSLTRKDGTPTKAGLGVSSNNFCNVILHHRRPGDLSIDFRPIATLWRQTNGDYERFREV